MTTPPPEPGFSRYYSGPGCGEQARPDFVLVGLPLPDGTVEVWASSELSAAELEADARARDIEWAGEPGAELRPVVTSVSYTLRAGLRSFVVVRAPTYRKALAGLAARPGWEPGERTTLG